MAWKVLVWVALLNSLAMAAPHDARAKRFMMSPDALQAKITAASRFKDGTSMEPDQDWSPVDLYPFPAPSSARPAGWSPNLSSRLSGFYLKDLISRRSSRQLTFDSELMAREHAQLVHDINALSEANSVWSRQHNVGETTTEYRYEIKDESIYMENLEPAAKVPQTQAHSAVAVSSTARPPTVNLKIVPSAVAGVKPALAVPVIVLGGDAPKAPQKHIMKHPYPFVGAASTSRPARLRPLVSFAYPMRSATPTLWQRFVSIFPKLIR